MSIFTQKPKDGDYPGYFARYIDLVPDGHLLDILNGQLEPWMSAMADWTEVQWMHRYAPEKYTVKEVIGHTMDTERIMAYRALCISRGESKDLPGFDDEEYVRNAQFNERAGLDIMQEWVSLRTANIHLFNSLSAAQLTHFGSANGLRINLKAIPYIIAGHAIHHTRVLSDRYGVDL
jgi:hypothetical protein